MILSTRVYVIKEISLKTALVMMCCLLGNSVVFAQSTELIETLEPRSNPFSIPSSRIGYFKNPGSAYGAIPAAVLFNFRLFVVGPNNRAKLEEAVYREREKLKAGETKRLAVLAKNLGNTIVFSSVVDASSAVLTDPNTIKVGEFEISKPGKIMAIELPYFSEVQHQNCVEKGLCNERVTYEDHKFAVDYLNGVQGKGLIDLKDVTARAGADAVIILTSDSAGDKYRVWNVDTKKEEAYSKKAEMAERGNAVWLLAESSTGNEYTIVYNQLRSVGNQQLGSRLSKGAQVGEYTDHENANFEVWRVNGPSEYFLRGKAYRVSPVQ